MNILYSCGHIPENARERRWMKRNGKYLGSRDVYYCPTLEEIQAKGNHANTLKSRKHIN